MSDLQSIHDKMARRDKNLLHRLSEGSESVLIELADDQTVNATILALAKEYKNAALKEGKKNNYSDQFYIDYAQKAMYIESLDHDNLHNQMILVDKPQFPEPWGSYSAEEILGMEANGAEIPVEVLAWAHQVADYDSTEYQNSEENEQAAKDAEAAVPTKDEVKKILRGLIETDKKSEVETERYLNEITQKRDRIEELKREKENLFNA